jgi:hypothetical protein
MLCWTPPRLAYTYAQVVTGELLSTFNASCMHSRVPLALRPDWTVVLADACMHADRPAAPDDRSPERTDPPHSRPANRTHEPDAALRPENNSSRARAAASIPMHADAGVSCVA